MEEENLAEFLGLFLSLVLEATVNVFSLSRELVGFIAPLGIMTRYSSTPTRLPPNESFVCVFLGESAFMIPLEAEGEQGFTATRGLTGTNEARFFFSLSATQPGHEKKLMKSHNCAMIIVIIEGRMHSRNQWLLLKTAP